LQIGGNSPKKKKKKPLVTSLIFILKFQKHWIGLMMISNFDLKCFQINLMLGIFMCLSLEVLYTFKFSFIKSNIFFSKKLSQFFGLFFLLFTFFKINFHYFFLFFPNKNYKVKFFWNYKNMLLVSQMLMPWSSYIWMFIHVHNF